MSVNQHIYELYTRLLADRELFRWLLDPSKEPDSNLIKIMQEDPEKHEAVNQLRTIFKHIKIEEDDLTEDARRELWSKIEAFIEKQKSKRRKILLLIRYAAACLILAGFSVCYFMLRDSQEEIPVDYERLISGMTPATGEGSNNIILVLDDDGRIEIGENKAQLRYDEAGRIYADSVLVKESESTENRGAELNRLYIPYGKTANIVMNDGTRVWVNSGSKVVYPPLFAGGRREIYVDGEVYLEVARNVESPFIVKTGVLDVRVLGTSFNVSAYSCDDGQSVVLASGSVSVKDSRENRISTIRPNQKYTYAKKDNSIRLQEVNAPDYTG